MINCFEFCFKFAFKFNLRRYVKDSEKLVAQLDAAKATAKSLETARKAGRRRLAP